MTERNFHKIFTMYFIIFGIVISLFGAFFSYIFQVQDIRSGLNSKASEIFEIKINTILKLSIRDMDDIVNSLANNKIINDFIITKNRHKEEELEEIFLAIANSNNQIMQARLLDSYGQEVIRVDRVNENTQAILIEKAKLQNKADREYFQILSKMSSGEVWHSKFNLNIENGEVEIPYKPTIRIGVPLFNNSEFSGIVIVNLLTKDLFASIGRSSAFEHFIIDKSSNYIFHPNDKYSFNKYKNISRDLRDDFAEGLDSDGVYKFALNNILQNDDEAILVLKVKDDYEWALINEKLKTAAVVLLLTIILSFIIAIFASRKSTKLQDSLIKAYDKLNEFTSVIDKYVITATTKKDSTILSVSTAFINSSGYSKNELIDKKMNIINHPDEYKELFKDLWKTISSGKTWCGVIQNKNKNGDSYWLEQHIVPTLDGKNEIVNYVSLGVDVTAKKELEKLASFDILTGIYNRRMLDEFIKIEIELANRHSNELSIIMIDIDHFKSVNDTYGHQVGDIVLHQTAQIILNNLRKSDIFGRYGGEEFMIISPNISKEEVFILAEKLRCLIHNFKFEKVGLKTISLGVSDLQDSDTSDSLIKRADNALYQAKNSGRDKTVMI